MKCSYLIVCSILQFSWSKTLKTRHRLRLLRIQATVIELSTLHCHWHPHQSSIIALGHVLSFRLDAESCFVKLSILLPTIAGPEKHLCQPRGSLVRYVSSGNLLSMNSSPTSNRICSICTEKPHCSYSRRPIGVPSTMAWALALSAYFLT